MKRVSGDKISQEDLKRKYNNHTDTRTSSYASHQSKCSITGADTGDQ